MGWLVNFFLLILVLSNKTSVLPLLVPSLLRFHSTSLCGLPSSQERLNARLAGKMRSIGPYLGDLIKCLWQKAISNVYIDCVENKLVGKQFVETTRGVLYFFKEVTEG